MGGWPVPSTLQINYPAVGEGRCLHFSRYLHAVLNCNSHGQLVKLCLTQWYPSQTRHSSLLARKSLDLARNGYLGPSGASCSRPSVPPDRLLGRYTYAMQLFHCWFTFNCLFSALSRSQLFSSLNSIQY